MIKNRSLLSFLLKKQGLFGTAYLECGFGGCLGLLIKTLIKETFRDCFSKLLMGAV